MCVWCVGLGVVWFELLTLRTWGGIRKKFCGDDDNSAEELLDVTERLIGSLALRGRLVPSISNCWLACGNRGSMTHLSGNSRPTLDVRHVLEVDFGEQMGVVLDMGIVYTFHLEPTHVYTLSH